jgi:hypothetical protein
VRLWAPVASTGALGRQAGTSFRARLHVCHPFPIVLPAKRHGNVFARLAACGLIVGRRGYPRTGRRHGMDGGVAGGEMAGNDAMADRRVTLVTATATILGHAPGPIDEREQVLVPFTGHNIVALVPGSRSRGVITELERGGVEGHRISYLRAIGSGGSATPEPRLDAGSNGRHEELPVVAGAALGALGGALLVGLLVLVLTDPEPAAWAALGGLLLGGALGAFWAVFRRLGASTAWERSLHTAPEERTLVGVHLDAPVDATEDSRVREVLAPFAVWVFDRDGTVVQRPDRSGRPV